MKRACGGTATPELVPTFVAPKRTPPAIEIPEMGNKKQHGVSSCAFLFACALMSFTFSVASADDNAAAIYKKLKPSLALVANYKDDRLLDVGSAFCVSSVNGKAYYVTNRHVVERGNRVVIIREYPRLQRLAGRVVRIGSGARDLALVLVIADAIPPVSMAVNQPDEGTHIGVAGYPRTQIMLNGLGLGLTPSLHTGTINALPADGFYLQYDAQTEPGNSGGPLFDLSTGDVYGIVVLKIGQHESNLAISVPELAEIASNAHVPLFVDSNNVVSQASPSPEPAPISAPTTTIDSDCVTALSEFRDAYNQWNDSFTRYVQASSRTTASSASATTRFAMVGPQISVGYELKAIRSTVDAEEPKVQSAQAAMDATKASETAQLTNDIFRQLQSIDQNSLSWTNQRRNLINNVAGGGAGFQIDQSLLQEIRSSQSTVTGDFDKLRYSETCQVSPRS